MGEVYRARDSKLKRDVALKVLPADVANDRERMARFQREAESASSVDQFPSKKSCPSPSRSPRRWKPRTSKTSSIAI